MISALHVGASNHVALQPDGTPQPPSVRALNDLMKAYDIAATPLKLKQLTRPGKVVVVLICVLSQTWLLLVVLGLVQVLVYIMYYTWRYQKNRCAQ